VPSRKILVSLIALLIAAFGFAAGFLSCLHLKYSPSTDFRDHVLAQPGDAPPSVRSAVVADLRILQDGYIHRDVATLDSFTKELFPKDGDILILGTNGDSGEWARGAFDARRFIRDDWLYWEDLHFNADQAIVWSSGDVAWTATIATLGAKKRPIRLTAILIREDQRWVFRQLQFQWADKGPSKSDLLQFKTYQQLASDAFQRLITFH
jgi:SnoaL-like domain